jgi:transposase
MTISELKLKSSAAEPVRRLEIFTGSGRRREWSPEDKARIVAESCAPNTTVSEVARRYALSPQPLFAWRRMARHPAPEASAPSFVPAIVTVPEPLAPRPASPRKRRAVRDAGIIELEIDGIAMRVGRGAEAKTIAAVIRALKAGA